MYKNNWTITLDCFTIILAGALAATACDEQGLEAETDPSPDDSGLVEDVESSSSGTTLSDPGSIPSQSPGAADELAEPAVSTGACPANQGTYVAVDASLGGHALALSEAGKVWAWGRNSRGQLGLGSITAFVNKPAQVNIPTRVVSIAAGANHSLALDELGQVWAWGDASSGQLGTGTVGYTSLPKQVSLSKNIVAIAAGGAFSLALDNQGRIWAWGANNYGQLGNGGTVNSSSPKLVTATPGCSYIEAIAAGEAFAVALSGGQVCTWGRNNRGQLGGAGASYRASAAIVQGVSGVSKVTAGKEYVIAANSHPWGWGDNSAGQLGTGDGAPSSYTSPVEVGTAWLYFRRADAGATHTVVGQGWGFSPPPPYLGFLRTAGSNGHGQLARAAANPSKTFAPIDRIGRLIAAGGDFTIIVESNNIVRAAGKNNEGQLGDGTQTSVTLLTNVCLP